MAKAELFEWASKEYEFLYSNTGRCHIAMKDHGAVCGSEFEVGAVVANNEPPILDLCLNCAKREGSLSNLKLCSHGQNLQHKNG